MTATPFASVLLLLAISQQPQPEPPAVTHEIKRLEACHPVFKLAPPPLNVRVVWTQPFDVVWSRESQDHVSIEFSVQYAQSDSFKTREEAEQVQSFNPALNLRQRLHYAIENGDLRLLWRESLIGSTWKRQKSTVPELSCWQTSPHEHSN
jgi:hypothetical protein